MDKEKRRKKFDVETIFIGITIILGIILVINILLAYNLKNDLQKSAEEIKEKLKPAKIELTIIKNSKCSDCFDISTILSHIKSANLNITKQNSVEFNSEEGKSIIKKYNIKKIPTIVITGEIDKVSVQGLEKAQNALLLASINPPYTNALNGEIEGKVILYNLKDPACQKCNDLAPLVGQIKSAGVRISEEKIIAPSSNEGKELTKKYRIDFAPTIILSKDAAAYDIMQKAWPQIGTKESDGSYVLRIASPPFINLTNGKLRGIVNIIYLTDKSCTECYDVGQHKEILTNQQSFAIKLEKEEAYDISEAKGKELIYKYNITQAPTVILSDEVNAYSSIQALKHFFSVEKDGSYVFRRLAALGTYKDLLKNQIVKAPQTSQGQ